MKVTNDIYYVGVNDYDTTLFEGQYIVKNGMCYNSYIIMDDKIAIMDSVDIMGKDMWLNNIKEVLGDLKPDYLIIQHMEPDHSANIMELLKVYPDTTLVGNLQSFNMIKQFFHTDITNKLIVKDNDTLNLGHHNLKFIFAPMVHWPEVMMTYDEHDKVLFTADGFGKFGANDVCEDWDDEARRYYIGICGKYGLQVNNLLKKASNYEIEHLCPLHGPVLSDNLAHYIKQYMTWSTYGVEKEGIVIAYSSVYGNTKKACEILAKELKEIYDGDIVMYDLSYSDISYVVSDCFKYSKLVLASITYNAGVFPHMHELINHLTERNYQKRQIALIENGSWAPLANKTMKDMLKCSKDLELIDEISIKSSLDEETMISLNKLANMLK